MRNHRNTPSPEGESGQPGSPSAVAREDLSDAEQHALLQVARCFFHAFARPQDHFWRHAVTFAQGVGGGDRILSVLLDSVDALSRSRVSPFRFINPLCQHCSKDRTAHERQFLACLTQLRAGRVGLAERHAFLLCEGNDTTEFLANLNRLPSVAAH